ncbi:sensor histidine kinase [Pseudoalteromonas maricaloris]|uniref:sensor histidine kinase n=1 Tax=Pseudoalteromonas maricaloris TaxID=184924 RepID=UPI001CB7067D|nr:ATP-binding protein [Pseudoalteromonas flavipulchra]
MMWNNSLVRMAIFQLAAIVFATLGVLGFLHSYVFLFSGLAIAIAVLFTVLSIATLKRQKQQFEEVFTALKYQDGSFRIDNKHSISKQALTTCNELIQKAQQDKTKQAELVTTYETMLQHIEAGLILIKNGHTILICNNSAKQLLDIRGAESGHSLLAAHPELEQAKVGSHIAKDLLFKYFTFSNQGNQYQLWLFTAISEQLESTQIESWQKLIRVLIHEIGNSVAPIYSLSNTLVNITNNQLAEALADQELVEDYLQSLQAIGIRSQSLLGFIDNYRKLTHIPELDLQPLAVQTLFDDITPLIKRDFRDANITLHFDVTPAALSINVDRKMIEQVLLNLLNNAKDAMKHNNQEKVVTVSATINRYGKCEINVADNGEGIEPSALDKIFVPFFTTKPHGSGIGLALSQQIIHRHKGRISATSEVGKGSCFSVLL